MKVTRLHRTPNVVLSAIACRPECSERGATEHAAYDSIVFVRRGAYCLHHGSTEAIIDPLSMLIFRKGDDYRVSHPMTCGDDCIEFGFAEEWIAGFDDDEPHTRRTAAVRADPGTLWRQCVLAHKAERGCASDLELEERAAELLSLATIRREQQGKRSASECKQVEKAKLLLLSDLARNWSLEEAAREAGVSRFHLTRLFKKHTGAPLYRFLTLARLAAALDRILDGENDLTRLALDLGFSSHSHFTAAFREAYGSTPRDTRTAAGVKRAIS